MEHNEIFQKILNAANAYAEEYDYDFGYEGYEKEEWDKLSDEDKVEIYYNYTDNLEEIIEEAGLEGIDFYYDRDGHRKDMLQLSDNRVLQDITVDIDPETYGEEVVRALEMFDEENNVETETLGRSGRHICIEPSLENLLRYKEIKANYEKAEKEFIDNINSDYSSDNLEESLKMKLEKINKEDVINGFEDYMKSIGLSIEEADTRFLGDYISDFAFDIEDEEDLDVLNAAEDEIIEKYNIPEYDGFDEIYSDLEESLQPKTEWYDSKKCARCKKEVPEGKGYVILGQTYCDECGPDEEDKLMQQQEDEFNYENNAHEHYFGDNYYNESKSLNEDVDKNKHDDWFRNFANENGIEEKTFNSSPIMVSGEYSENVWDDGVPVLKSFDRHQTTRKMVKIKEGDKYCLEHGATKNWAFFQIDDGWFCVEEKRILVNESKSLTRDRTKEIIEESLIVKEDKEVPYDNTTEKKCPKCGMTYTQYPALSRRDNKTYICPDCGVDEAMEDYLSALKRERNKNESKRLNEKQWDFKLDNSIRKAIEDENNEEIINCLKKYAKQVEDSNLDEYVKDSFKTFIEDYEFEFDDILNGEVDEGEIEDTINYILDDFYDLCDNTNVFIEIGLNESLDLKLEAFGLSLTDMRVEDGMLKVKINGKEYGYQHDELTPEQLKDKFDSIAKHSEGKAFAWLKAHSRLVLGGKKKEESLLKEEEAKTVFNKMKEIVKKNFSEDYYSITYKPNYMIQIEQPDTDSFSTKCFDPIQDQIEIKENPAGDMLTLTVKDLNESKRVIKEYIELDDPSKYHSGYECDNCGHYWIDDSGYCEDDVVVCPVCGKKKAYWTDDIVVESYKHKQLKESMKNSSIFSMTKNRFEKIKKEKNVKLDESKENSKKLDYKLDGFKGVTISVLDKKNDINTEEYMNFDSMEFGIDEYEFEDSIIDGIKDILTDIYEYTDDYYDDRFTDEKISKIAQDITQDVLQLYDDLPDEAIDRENGIANLKSALEESKMCTKNRKLKLENNEGNMVEIYHFNNRLNEVRDMIDKAFDNGNVVLMEKYLSLVGTMLNKYNK